MNSAPVDSPGDHPQSGQIPPPRRKATPQPALPRAPPAPRLHEDGGVRLEGGQSNDPDILTDVPPAYREYPD